MASNKGDALRSSASLRSRLLRFLLLPLLSVVAISVWSDYRSNLSQSNNAYDHALASSAVALAALVGQHQGKVKVDLPPSAEALLRTDPFDHIFFAIYDNEGRRVAGDADLHAAANEEMPAEGGTSFQDAVLRGQNVRVATYRAPGPEETILIVVAETVHKREDAATRAVVITAVADLLLVAATLLVVYFGVRLALAPLVGLRETISRRGPGDLRPLPENDVPAEVVPLIAAINGHMENLRRAHEAQQAFISNAAHQLRTPIAALQTQLELAAENLPEDVRPRLAKLRDAFRRLSHMTHQMLALARSLPEADLAHEFQTIDLSKLCEEAASEFLDDALAKHIDLGFETEKAEVTGSPWLLRELLANLIDNAIVYTLAGGHITVRCGTEEGKGGYLEVEDNGPGIPPELRDRIFERFFRGPPANAGIPGTGLGLAIVQEVAQRHGAHIDIVSPQQGQGVCFRVNFPRID